MKIQQFWVHNYSSLKLKPLEQSLDLPLFVTFFTVLHERGMNLKCWRTSNEREELKNVKITSMTTFDRLTATQMAVFAKREISTMMEKHFET